MGPFHQAPPTQHSSEASKASLSRSNSSDFSGASAPSRDEVVVRIDDDHDDNNGLPFDSRRETSRNLTFSNISSPPPTIKPESSIFPSSSPPQLTNLWREVSSDYLQGLDAPEDIELASARQKSRSRRKHERPKSFDFEVALDPPTKLIENFLQRQAASGNLCLDMDMDMMETLPLQETTEGDLLVDLSAIPTKEEVPSVENAPSRQASSTNPSPRSSLRALSGRETRGVSFQPTQSLDHLQEGALTASISFGEKKKGRSLKNGDAGHARDDDGCDRYCSEDSSSEDESERIRRSRTSSLTRMQTRSRLADPPPPPPPQVMAEGAKAPPAGGMHRSTQLRSGPMRSGLLQKLGKTEEEEDDPLKDADIPESYRKHKWSALMAFQWIAFFLIMAGLVSSLTVPALKKRPLWSMALWKWALLILLLFCGRLVSGWVIRIIVIILERNFLLRKRVLYFVYGLRKGVQNCLWFAFAVIAWRLVFDPKVETATNSKVLPYVTKLLNCFLLAAFIWLIKIFLVKVLASSFHVSTFFERIRESLFGQWVLETLSGPPVIEMEQEAKVIEELDALRKAGAKVPEGVMPKVPAVPMGVNATGKSGMIDLGRSGMVGKSGLIGGLKSGMIAGKSGLMGKSGLLKGQHSMEGKSGNMQPQEGISIDDLHRLNEKNISAWNMKRLMNIVRYRGIYTLAHVIDQSAAEAQDEESHDVEIESEWQARTVAKKIFKNVAKPGARYIVRKDLLRFMRDPDVERAMPLFEGAMDTGKITKTALKNFAVHVVRERRALSLSLNDTKTAVKKLHRIVDVIVGVLIVIICLLILGITTTHLLLLISSQLVLVVFIFGNTCKTVFEAIVFLFVMHPFDVGDRCVVDGNQVVVEEMNILSTLFVRYDGEKVWYPNTLLATKYIFNYHRTADTGDTFDFSIEASTPVEKIQSLKDKIAKYIYSKPSHWARDHNLVVKDIEDNNKMKFQLMVNHTINYGDLLERQIRRSDLILDVNRMMQELDIRYNLLPQEVKLGNPSSSLTSSTTTNPPFCNNFEKTHLKAL